MEKIKEKIDFDFQFKAKDKKSIVIYNDDVNTFEWVIQSLV